MRPFDTGVRLYPYLWSDGVGGEGVAFPYMTSAAADLALLGGTFQHFYQIAPTAPLPGTPVHFIGYDWSNKSKGYDVRRFDAKVLRVVAGHVVMDHAGEPGSSGSCVLDGQDQIIGVNCAGHTMNSGEDVGIAVGAWTEAVKQLLARGEE